MEIVRLPKSCPNDEVEGKFCGIFGELGFNIAKDDLGAAHSLTDE